MFLPIPNFPHYMWNPDTLEVKSLQRIVNDNGGLRKIKEKILMQCRTSKLHETL